MQTELNFYELVFLITVCIATSGSYYTDSGVAAMTFEYIRLVVAIDSTLHASYQTFIQNFTRTSSRALIRMLSKK